MKSPIENQGIAKKIVLTFKVIKNVKNFPDYFKDLFRLTKEKYLLYQLRNGLKFIVRAKTPDRHLINEIFIKRDYTKYFGINENDTVVDIGANIGMFSILAASYAKKGKVYSFEPMDENFELLKMNAKLNDFSNIICINKAITKKNGKMFLNISDDNFGGNSFSDKHWQVKKGSRKVSVETVTLRSIMQKYEIEKIDFLKVDCEGSEYEILFNLSNKELSKIKKMSIEFHNFDGGNQVVELIKFLQNNGFKIKVKDFDYPIGIIYAINNN